MKARLSKAKRWLLGHVRFNRQATVLGRRYTVPVIFNHGEGNLRPYEPAMTKITAAALRAADGAFLDVGSNAGQFMLKVCSLDPGRRYIGFDVSIFNAYYVQQLIDLNSLGNCTSLAVGLSSGLAVVELESSADGDPQASIVPGFWTGDDARANSSTAIVVSGDEVVHAVGSEPVGIIKIDVEGAELDVIRGLSATIRRDRPILIVEVLPYEQTSDGSPVDTNAADRMRRSDELRAIIIANDYRLFRLLPDGSHARVDSFAADSYLPDGHNFIGLSEAHLVPYFATLKSAS